MTAHFSPLSESSSWQELSPLLDGEIDQLKPADRMPLLLRFVNQLGFAEIGRHLCVSEDAARMRVERALEKLRDRLARRGATTSAAALTIALTSHAVEAAPAALAPATSLAVLSGTAATASLPVLATLQLMISSKTVFVAAGAALLLAAGTATYEGLAWSQAHAAAIAAEASANAAKAERDRLARELGTAATAAITVKPPSATPKAVAPNRGAHGGAGTFPWSSEGAAERGRDFLERHPEVRAALERQADEQTESKFSALFAELDLTPEEIAVFKVLHRRGTTIMTVLGDGAMYRFDVSSEPIDFSQRLRVLLGNERYDRYRQFQAASFPRQQTQAIASDLVWVDPLTPGQFEQLASYVSASMGPSGLDWEKLLMQARPLFSDKQLEIVDGLRKQASLYRTAEAARKTL